jgi:hypothetical protein|nr:MAG TPA: hypothetical protein [Caudoviricetes sp.]
MSINFIFGLILAMVVGTIVSYLVIQGADFLISYIRKNNFYKSDTYLKDWRIVDFDSDIPAVQINAEEFTDDEAILDAQECCKDDDRIVFIMVKTADKANLVTKNGVLDVTDIYKTFHKEENNEPEDEDTDRTDDRDDNDSSDEDRQ